MRLIYIGVEREGCEEKKYRNKSRKQQKIAAEGGGEAFLNTISLWRHHRK
jgi:hypothetical protein